MCENTPLKPEENILWKTHQTSFKIKQLALLQCICDAMNDGYL